MHFNEPINFKLRTRLVGSGLLTRSLPFNRTHGCSLAQEWGGGSA
jgi:hypothetical protein